MGNFHNESYLSFLSVFIVAVLVILGVPGPIFGIGFGCLINNLLISTLVVTTGKLLGDIITYYLIKFWISHNPEI
jgi:membrane protein YqaA with SNARE-associated domain